MAITGMFFDAVKTGDVYDREYSSGDFSKYLNNIVGNGVFPDPSTQLQVRAGSGMEVIVAAGEGWIDGHKIINSADMILSIDAADALLGRIDRIIFYADYTNREMGISVLKGENALTPTAPAITRDASRYEMCLAEISIAKQTTAITQAMITDTRGYSDICGWAAGIIDQVDTSTLFVQWQDAFSTYYATIKQQLDDFMEALTEELQVNTYMSEIRVAASFTKGDSEYIRWDLSGYVNDPKDIVDVYLNGMHLYRGIDYRLYIGDGYVGVTLLQIDSSQLPAGVNNRVEVRILMSKIGIEGA